MAIIHSVNIRTFDLNLLRALEALIDESSVSAAAKRLHLSQPATSSALARLRDALGDPLLVRRGARMVRTPAAEALLPAVRRVLSDIESALRDRGAFDPSTSSRTFRIGVNDYAAAILLPALWGRLQRFAPRMQLEAVSLDHRIEERWSGLDLDLALSDRESLRAAESVETLFEEDHVCVARKDHPRLPARPRLKHYLAERHIRVAPHGRSSDAVEAALLGLGHRREVAMSVPHYLVAPMLALQSDLVLTTARHVALHAAQTMALRTFTPPFAIPRFPVAMAWSRQHDADDAQVWLREQLRRGVRGEP